MGRLLIIGCGYLGRRVASAWLQQGETVLALTRSSENAAVLRDLGIEPVLGDVTVPETLSSLPVAETVLYAVGLDRGSGKTQREVYVDGLRNVLHVLSPGTRRFLYVSSTSVYGQDAGEWVDETSPCEPSSPNGKVCLDAEQIVWSFFPRDVVTPATERGANVLRLSGIYGPGRLIARVESLRRGEPLAGNPAAWLNLIHVDDAVVAILACERNGKAGETYLVSDDKPYTRCEYYTRLANIVGAPPPTFSETIEDGASATVSGLNKRICNQKMRDQLRMVLTYPTLAEGLPDACVRLS